MVVINMTVVCRRILLMDKKFNYFFLDGGRKGIMFSVAVGNAK